ncbi:MAG: biosynthetic-type acetolactate synthase large subunit [Myxococcota bacterium]
MTISIQSIEDDAEPDEIPKPQVARTLEGARAIWEVLVEEGVEVVFGYPGGAIMPTYDVMPEYPVRHVLVRHEQSAAHMADGYARASGGVGVALATSGPGATNLVTGIANAMLDSIPMVCITGQVPSHLIGSDAFQETDVSGVTLPITKYNYLVTRAVDVAPTLREAFELARSGRQGPVLVDITKDAQIERAEFEPRRKRPIRKSVKLRSSIRPNQLEEARQMIRTSCRPLALVGHGIIKSGAAPELFEFIERTQIPVASTLLGLGSFPASHPLHLGMLGMHGEMWVNNAVQESDLIIALGMRFDDRVTGKPSTFAPNARKIHVEIDAAEINKNVKVDLAIHGDVRLALQGLNSIFRKDGSGCASVRFRAWHDRIAEERWAALDRDIIRQPDGGRLWAAHVLHDLWEITEGRALLSTDVGQHQMWAAQYYRHDTPRSLLTSGGLGTMGFALPAAIGARFARPEDEIWVVAGDGGFQMTAPELSTLLQEDLKLNIAIINNQYLGMVRQWQEMFFDGRIVATPISAPDFVKLAEAHGHEGIRVTQRSEVEPAIRRAREAKHTVVIDFRVEPEDIVYPIVPSGKAIHEMIRRPPST